MASSDIQARSGGDRSGARIEITGLTKRFGSLTAVDDLTFTVEPGRITGFLGPNGAGKTTTLRMLLGLIRPTAGTATIDGASYAQLRRPMTVVGAALEATNFHPGRSGRNHLRVLADASGIPASRVDAMLDLVELGAAARRRAGGYSMGMRQRLGLAAAMLGEPRVLVLDEPANGLDPEGIRWLRQVLRRQADEGTTILVSSHLLSEVQQTVDDVVIISNGRLVRAGSMESLQGQARCLVRTSDPTALARALFAAAQLTAQPGPDADSLHVATADLRRVGQVALEAGLPVFELRAEGDGLEELFFALTEGSNRNIGRTADAPPVVVVGERAGGLFGQTPGGES